MKVKIKHLFAGFAILSSLLIFGCTQLQDSLSSSNDDETTTSSTSTSSGEGKTILSGKSLSEVLKSPNLLVSSSDMPESASSITITYTVGSNDKISSSSTWITAYSDTSWSNETKIANAWQTEFNESAQSFSITVNDSAAISAFIKNGIFIGADTSEYTGTISVTYTE